MSEVQKTSKAKEFLKQFLKAPGSDLSNSDINLSKSKSKGVDDLATASKAMSFAEKNPKFMKGLKVAGNVLDVGGVGLDIAMGGMALAESTKGTNQRKIATDAVSLVANVAVDVATSSFITSSIGLTSALATGPFAILVALGQILGMLLDQFWDPFKLYYNPDLKDFKTAYDSAVQKMFLDEGYNWPLEMKPNIMPITEDDLKIFSKYIQEYYANNKIISPEQAFNEKEIIKQIASMTRMTKRLFVNEDGSINKDAVYDTVSYLDEDSDIEEYQMILDIARKVIEKRRKKNLQNFKSKIIVPNRFIQFSQKNWQIYIIILICILLIIFSCSIVITKFKNE